MVPMGRIAASTSRLSSVLPRPFRRRSRGDPADPRSATLPPAQQPLLSVAGRPVSPYHGRHWYDPGYSSRTLPWNGRAARRGAAATRTAEPTAARRHAADGTRIDHLFLHFYLFFFEQENRQT